jgi:hypothetical protein
VNYAALIACLALLLAAVCGATWLAARLGRRGGATTPEPLDEYGDAALGRLPRAPSLPPPGYEELRVDRLPLAPSRCQHSVVLVPTTAGDALICVHCGARRE